MSIDRRTAWLPGAMVLLSLLGLGCLFDSSYWQQKSAQRNVAQQQTPRSLQATPGEASASTGLGASRARVRRLRVHVRATPGYAAEVVEWPRQFAALLDDANQILEPTLNVRFEVADAGTWTTKLGSDRLDDLLAELRSIDHADDADCVIGLAGSLPVFTHSFHQLGLADVMGKHLVMRAMNDAREREAIEVELSRLDADERETLYQKRKRHKATAVFLHEVGHTLGLIHEAQSAAIMSTHYDKAMSAFSPASADVMRRTLEYRAKPPAERNERAFTEGLLEVFERPRGPWVLSERDAMIASLKSRLAAPSPDVSTDGREASTVRRPAATHPDDVALKDVAPADRALLLQAIDDEQAGRPAEARTKAEPLFARYPDVYAVQDLRCKLAMELSAVWQVTRRECDRLMNLSHGKAETPPK